MLSDLNLIAAAGGGSEIMLVDGLLFGLTLKSALIERMYSSA